MKLIFVTVFAYLLVATNSIPDTEDPNVVPAGGFPFPSPPSGPSGLFPHVVRPDKSVCNSDIECFSRCCTVDGTCTQPDILRGNCRNLIPRIPANEPGPPSGGIFGNVASPEPDNSGDKNGIQEGSQIADETKSSTKPASTDYRNLTGLDVPRNGSLNHDLTHNLDVPWNNSFSIQKPKRNLVPRNNSIPIQRSNEEKKGIKPKKKLESKNSKSEKRIERRKDETEKKKRDKKEGKPAPGPGKRESKKDETAKKDKRKSRKPSKDKGTKRGKEKVNNDGNPIGPKVSNNRPADGSDHKTSALNVAFAPFDDLPGGDKRVTFACTKDEECQSRCCDGKSCRAADDLKNGQTCRNGLAPKVESSGELSFVKKSISSPNLGQNPTN